MITLRLRTSKLITGPKTGDVRVSTVLNNCFICCYAVLSCKEDFIIKFQS